MLHGIDIASVIRARTSGLNSFQWNAYVPHYTLWWLRNNNNLCLFLTFFVALGDPNQFHPSVVVRVNLLQMCRLNMTMATWISSLLYLWIWFGGYFLKLSLNKVSFRLKITITTMMALYHAKKESKFNNQHRAWWKWMSLHLRDVCMGDVSWFTFTTPHPISSTYGWVILCNDVLWVK